MLEKPIMHRTYPSVDLKTCGRLAEQIAGSLKEGDVVALFGPLGAGKSAFSRAMIRHCLQDNQAEVPSPTFTLVQPYERNNGPDIYHCDLYRLTTVDELYELGLEDVKDQSILVVEWPEKLPTTWLKDALHVTFSIMPTLDESDENYRQVTFAGDARWQNILSDMGGDHEQS